MDKDNNPICTSCYSWAVLDDDKCLTCSHECLNCSKIESDNEKKTICYECNEYNSIFDPEKNDCINCGSIPDLGNGCRKCRYDNIAKKYECLQCSNNYYVYVNNTFQCFDNRDKNQKYLYGCLQAYKTNDKIYECLKCEESFILDLNDKICINPDETGLSLDCLDFENLGTIDNPLYSCLNCKNNTALITLNSTGIKDCVIRKNYSQYCLEGKIGENGNYICTKCVEDANLNSSGICECNFDAFGKSEQFCYKCDDEKYGNIGCIASKGCKYYHSNDELDCNECKEGFFEYTKGQCFSCLNKIGNCDKCHFDNVDEELKCDNCISIYLLKEEKTKCELDECQEYLLQRHENKHYLAKKVQQKGLPMDQQK